MGKHALLSASSSRRWLSCTPSARLEEQFQEESGGSVYAEEGTAAHALAEHKLKKALKRRSKRPVSDYHCDEMEECTDGYVAYAMEQVELARQECSDPVVLIEQRLDYSAYVPEGFGTGDLLIVADKVLTVIDLKYGKGVAVDAEWNPQMMLYGLGALELFDALYDIETIRMVIYQPRLESVSTWEISVKDLIKCQTMAMFASIRDIRDKEVWQLKKLRAMGINGLSIGTESGDDDTLTLAAKGYTAADILEQCRKLDEAGIEYYFVYMTGLAGKGRGYWNAVNSAKLFSQLNPYFISVDSLTLFPDTELYRMEQEGRFVPAGEKERLRELQVFIQNLQIRTHLFANSSSNFYPVTAYLPKERDSVVSELQHIMDTVSEKEMEEYRRNLKSLG